MPFLQIPGGSGWDAVPAPQYTVSEGTSAYASAERDGLTQNGVSPVDSEAHTNEELAMYKRADGGWSPTDTISAGPSFHQCSYSTSPSLATPPTGYDRAYYTEDEYALAAPGERRASEPVSSAQPPGNPSSVASGSGESGPAVQAAAEAEDDGTIGVEIQVRHGSKYLRNLSAMGIPAGDGQVWDPRRPWGLRRVEGEKSGGGSSRRQSVETSTDSAKGQDQKGEEEPVTGKRDSLDDLEPITVRSKGKGKEIGEGRPLKKEKGKAKAKGQGEDRPSLAPPMSIVIFIVGSRGTFAHRA